MTLDNPLPVSSLPRAVRARLEDSITGELQIMAAPVVQGYETEIDQHEEKIRQLRDYITRVKEICNSRVSINLLPQELLLQILRSVTEQLWLDRSAQVRLRQVCRLWCNVIDRSPRFWMDHLAPDIPTTLTRIRGYFHIVLAAFEKTKSVARLSFSLDNRFLPTFASLPSHASRISTLWLDCLTGDSGTAIQLFLDLDMRQLEELTLWRFCNRSPQLELDSDSVLASRFPRLKYLRTNCMQLALQWVTPAMRTLLLGGLLRGSEQRFYVPNHCQCRLGSLRDLCEALRRCPELDELRIDYCLPATAVASHGDHGPSAPKPLERLNWLHLAGELEDVRTVLEQLAFPETTQVSLGGGEQYHRLSDLLPRRRPLTAISRTRFLTLCIGRTPGHIEDHIFSAYGEIEQDDRHLSLHCRAREGVKPWLAYDNFDLLIFFRSVIGCFPPSNITRLRVNCFVFVKIRRQEGWPWLFQSFPNVSDLVLDVHRSGDAGVYSALASSEALVRLQRLQNICLSVLHPKIRDALLSMLEQRASQGLRLRSVTFTQEISRSLKYVPPPLLADAQIARVKAVTDEMTLERVSTC